MENIAVLKNILAKPKKIVIVTHRNPDGDAFGSSLGLKYFLEKFQHSVTVVCPSEYPDFFDWMPGVSDILITDLFPEQVKNVIKTADLVFNLDYNALFRVDETGKMIPSSPAQKILIDHHLEPEDFADFTLSDTTASSTCQLIVEFITLLGDQDLIDTTIGECLFTGILTDTGSFRHATSPKLYRIVADLVERGVDDKKIQDLIFNSLTEKNLRLIGYCIKDKLEIIDQHQVGIISLSKSDYETYDIQRGDTEGVVNMILRIKKVQIAILITEQKNIVKLSFRSKGDISVQEIASKYYNGGGHKNASGGMSTLSLEDSVRQLKKILDHHFKAQ